MQKMYGKIQVITDAVKTFNAVFILIKLFRKYFTDTIRIICRQFV